MSDPLLEVENLVKDFGGIRALDDLTVQVNEGTITGFIGPNGAGKTTFFNVITGVLDATSGVVRSRGREITDAERHEICRLGISRTFQTPQPFHRLTVEENIRTAAHFGGNRTDRFNIDEILDMVDLAGRRADYPDSLQLVEQKYLDFARVLATDPELILLDEILAGLTPSEKQAFGDVITDLHEQFGITFFMVEHDLKTIRSLCDELLVINDGRLLASGDTEEVMTDEAVQEAYVA